MMKIKKGYNSKITLSMVSLVLLFNTTVNSSPISKDLLRVPIRNYERITKTIGDSDRKDNISSSLLINAQIKAEFSRITRGIYPYHVIDKLQKDGYSPIIIGYYHDNLGRLVEIKHTFEKIKQENPGRRLKVALEIIPPDQLQHIKDFLVFEKEYKISGTIHGKKPHELGLISPEEYRAKLEKRHAEHLALWLLEHDFDVIPIEHQNVERWIRQDESVTGDIEEEGFFGTSIRPQRQAYTAIRRDINGLHVMERERPDIISVGLPHALKYELLLDRDGTRNSYFFGESINWNQFLRLWENAHNEYRQNNAIAENGEFNLSTSANSAIGDKAIRNNLSPNISHMPLSSL